MWTATAYSELPLPPGATSTLSGDTLATKSGEPVTVTLIAAEQLLSTSDSPSTGSTQTPRYATAPNGPLNVIEASPSTDSPGSSARTDVPSSSSSEVVISESVDKNALTLVAGAAALPWLRMVNVKSKLTPDLTNTKERDVLATKSGELGGGSVPESPQAARPDAATTTAQHGHFVQFTVSSHSCRPPRARRQRARQDR